MIAGSVTGLIASTLSEPLDVMRTRLIAQGKNQVTIYRFSKENY